MRVSDDGMHYEGEWIVGTQVKEGRGVLLWPNGSRYEGMFKINYQGGKGRLIHSDGDVY